METYQFLEEKGQTDSIDISLKQQLLELVSLLFHLLISKLQKVLNSILPVEYFIVLSSHCLITLIAGLLPQRG